MKAVRFLALLAAIPLWAQLPMTPQQVQKAAALFDRHKGELRMNCKIFTAPPFLDFSFRFNIGYMVECPVQRFLDLETPNVAMLVRVTPEGGQPVMLGEHFGIPPIPEALRRGQSRPRASDTLQFSGDFTAGEGKYDIELVFLDENRRLDRKSWNVRTGLKGRENQARVSLPPGKVEPAMLPKWGGTSTVGGLRVSILLDAAPMYSNAPKLRAWDRAFLMGTLTSVLRHLPLASAEVVAFNLDQQAEIFRERDFQPESIRKLAGQLQALELGAINYKKLQWQDGWQPLLLDLFGKAGGRPGERPDVIIILGPRNRLDDKLDETALARLNRAKVPTFYLEYFPFRGYEFPDTIEHATDAFSGTTYRLYTPGDLALSLEKMRRKLESSGVGGLRKDLEVGTGLLNSPLGDAGSNSRLQSKLKP